MTQSSLSTATLLAGQLRTQINNGTLPPGARLVERELAAQFSVSRIPMREAIRQLAQEGLVELHLNRGAAVRILSEAEIGHIYHLRALLEGDAIFNSVPHLDSEALARAGLVHQLLEEASSPEKQAALNLEFHNILYAACDNPRQLSLIADLRQQTERYAYLQRQLMARTPLFQQEHAAILNACRAGDAGLAQRKTVEHLLSAGEILRNTQRQEKK